MEAVLHKFYSAFARGDHATMGACYHDQARFSDPVFPDLDARGVRAMWKMLLSGGGDLRITFKVLEENANGGRCRWEAFYTFSKTGRPVHNVVSSTVIFKDGLIVKQVDEFDFWRWSRQALGMSGVLLGWTPIVRNKVRTMAADRLRKAMVV